MHLTFITTSLPYPLPVIVFVMVSYSHGQQKQIAKDLACHSIPTRTY